MIGWAVETLAATTLLMLVVLAIRAPVRARFGPHIAYALWMIPLARMVLPPLPGEWRARAIEPLADMGHDVTFDVLAPIALSPTMIDIAEDPVSLAATAAPWLILAWAAGALFFIGYHCLSHGLFVARVLRGARREMRVAGGTVRVIETDATTGPLAFGIWHKTIAFPRDFSERYDEQERALALAHELGHHARGDLIANWAALAVLALHWFNPVAWRAFRAFRADQEMACDALVLAGRPQSLRHAYGRAIVKSAHGGAVSAACHLHTINDLKGRLKMLTKHEPTPRSRLFAGGAALTGLTLAGLALTASGTAAAEKMRERVELATGVELAAIDLPAPLAPLAPLAGQVATTPVPPSTAPEAPMPPEPPAAPATPKKQSWTWSTESGEGKEKRRVVFRRIQGTGADAKDLPQVLFLDPEKDDDVKLEDKLIAVREGKCGKEKHGSAEIIRTETAGKRQLMIICADRIAKLAADASKHADLALADANGARVLAMQSRRMGLTSAMMGLRHARTSIEMQDSLSADQKREALAGIDQAIREIEQEQQSPDE